MATTMPAAAVDWKLLDKILAPLALTDEQLRRLSSHLLDEMQLGLAKETAPTATLKMLSTYVRAVPTGKETGRFLALDLGGTNFRVLVITLESDGKVQMKSRIFAIPQAAMVGTGAALFDHIAECISKFIEQERMGGETLPLGFTFSFPCKQLGLASATLIKWTKGFTAAGVEGEDVVQLLLDAVERRKQKDISLDIVAVVNDTTGTLMSCAHDEPDCAVGLIVGTGTNACYIEKLDNVGKWEGDRGAPNELIINMEWGALGDNGKIDFLRSAFDRQVDDESLNPGYQRFEKMISGMFLGELVRLVLLCAIRKGALLGGNIPPALEEHGAFYTKFLSEIESDSGNKFTKCRQVLIEELGIPSAAVSHDVCRAVQQCCAAVSKRAAYMSGAATSTLLNRMRRPRVTVAVDGSVYKFHPHFHKLMSEQIKRQLDDGLQFKLMLSEDGSGKGAALVAAVAVRLDKH